MSSVKDHTFDLYNINAFPTDFPVSHESALLKQMVDYEEKLKTTNPEQPKRLYTLRYLLQDDEKQTEDDEGVQSAAGQQKQMKHPRKPSSCPAAKRRPSATATCKVHDKKMKNTPTPAGGFMPKPAAPKVMHGAGHGISNSPGGGIKNASDSVGDPEVSAESSTGAVTNEGPISAALARKINEDIKCQLMKEVRRFGRKYERIFTLFEEVQGPLALKKQFVEFTIKEAARFKRVVLIQQLEKVLARTDSFCCLKKANPKKSRDVCSCKDQ